MAVLRAEIEALQDGVRTPDQAAFSRLYRQVQQLATLVDDLRQTLDHADGPGAMDNIPVDMAALVAESVATFRPRYAATGLAIEVAGGDDVRLGVRGDPGRLNQVLANLLENSLRYTDRGGKLRITLGVMNQHIAIQFDDTAPAPPRAAMAHLFDRFFRAEPSRSRVHGGSGLGLAICKTLVEAHGGRIAASMSELGGLCLCIELPLEKT